MKTTFYLLIAAFLLVSVASQAQQKKEVLTNENILAMNSAKVSPKLIIQKINVSIAKFDTSVPGILALKSVDLPEPIIEAMLTVSRPSDILQNEGVIQLVQGRCSKKLVIQRIQAGTNKFDTSTDGLIQLKIGRIPESIIKVMMTNGSNAGGGVEARNVKDKRS